MGETRIRALILDYGGVISNPVGLIELGAPVDEYECLVGPLMRMLEKNICPEKIADYLTQHIPDHFGVSPPDGAQEFSEEIVNWFLKQWKNSIV